jgi:hypothetical protein
MKEGSKMFKKFFILLFAVLWMNIFSSPAFSQTYDSESPIYTHLLSKYVSGGVVDYQKMQSEKDILDAYLKELSGVSEAEFTKWEKPAQIAYLINLYNASTLQLVLENYPVESIKKIRKFFKGPWDQELITLFGAKVTLNHIEHEMLRKNYNEPRIHFALVCAARSCPPLRSEAYTAVKLEDQLKDQGKLFFAQASKNRLDALNQTLYLSPIFKWFKEDFEKETASLLDFVKPYLKDEAVSASWTIKYTHYDWSLNERSARV